MIHTIVYDIDGVLANFTRGFSDLAARLGIVPAGWDNDEQQTWDYDFHVDPVWRATEGEPFWLNLPRLVTDADVAFMNEAGRYTETIYLTGRKETGSVRAQTQRWLEQHGFPDGAVILADNKAQALEAMCTYPEHAQIIDDSPKVIDTLRSAGYDVVVRHAPYNAHVEGPRVLTVADFLNNMHMEPADAERECGV